MPETQWADLYNEGGSLDMGEGAEGTAPCEFVVASVGERGQQQHNTQQQQQVAQQQGSVGPHEQQQQQGSGAAEWRVSCGPHKVRVECVCLCGFLCTVLHTSQINWKATCLFLLQHALSI